MLNYSYLNTHSTQHPNFGTNVLEMIPHFSGRIGMVIRLVKICSWNENVEGKSRKLGIVTDEDKAEVNCP